MSKQDRVVLIVLGVMIVLAAALILVGPWRARTEPAPEEQQVPGQVETETMPARVIEILEEGTVDLGGGSTQPYQRVLVRVESGSLAGLEVAVEEGTINIVSQERLFRVGDRVYLERMTGPSGERFYVSDFIRAAPLFWIAVMFVGLVALVGRGRGLRAIVGTLFSLVVILTFILPQILAGRDPVVVSIAGAVILLSVSTYLVYGWNWKAHAAVAGMILSLALTGALAWTFVKAARLTGMSEEAGLLAFELGQKINLQGLVLGGIIIGSLGVLDDICVGQASAVFELANLNRELSWHRLFRSSLNIGRDHIAAMVNTLLLAYVGASMPLMLAFMLYSEPFWRRINREPIAEEIVRALVGSAGLILAVPLTGLIASLLARWAVRRGEDQARSRHPKQKEAETMDKKVASQITFLWFKIRDLFTPPEKVLSEVEIGEGFRVLDYGCGPGGFTVAAAERVGRPGKVYAVDANPLAIEQVRAVASKRGLENVETILTDCATGLESSAVDVVLLYDTFHDLQDPAGVMSELHRVLRPGGVLSFSDHHLKEEEVVSRVTGGGLFELSGKGEKTYTFTKGGS